MKSYDLVWLLHLVGDVHQPLHAVSRFNSEQRDGDRGGNGVAICAPACGTNLHSFWDAALGTSNNPEAAIARAKELPPPDPRRAAIADEGAWIDESFRLARTAVYVDPIGVGPGPFTINERYRNQARTLAAQQVWVAGVRLANLLNESLKGVPLEARVGSGDDPGEVAQVAKAAKEPTVIFNEQSLKYHDPECRWARACARNCIAVPLSEAIRRGGKACKVCGGGRN